MSNEIQNHYKPETAGMGEVEKSEGLRDPTTIENLGVYQKLAEVVCPQICTWYFMKKIELTEFLKISSKTKIREKIGNK